MCRLLSFSFNLSGVEPPPLGNCTLCLTSLHLVIPSSDNALNPDIHQERAGSCGSSAILRMHNEIVGFVTPHFSRTPYFSPLTDYHTGRHSKVSFVDALNHSFMCHRAAVRAPAPRSTPQSHNRNRRTTTEQQAPPRPINQQ